MNKHKEPSVVLAIDDEPIVQETFKAVLKGHFKVLTAGNGQEALDKIARYSINLIFLDINIAGMNGIDLLRKIKEYDKNLPVIVVTGIENEILEKEVVKLGGCGYINKPFELSELIGLAHKAINREETK